MFESLWLLDSMFSPPHPIGRVLGGVAVHRALLLRQGINDGAGRRSEPYTSFFPGSLVQHLGPICTYLKFWGPLYVNCSQSAMV
jgi:hypothetical protein